MDLRLDGMVAWITGASGGIGRALADAFAAEGALLALQAGSRADDLRAFVDGRPWKSRALVMEGDVRDPASVDGAAAAAADWFGRVDLCVPNAGIWPPEDLPLDRMDPGRIKEVLDVNLLGALLTARAFLATLRRTGPRPDGRGAALVLVGSTSGRFGERGHAEYSASKSALRGLCLSLKNEIVALDPAGRVNLVEPGWTATEMTRAQLARPGAAERAVRTAAIARIASPADVARAACWLASPAAGHVTGEVLTVAGGMEGRVQRELEEVDGERIRREAGAGGSGS